jgi:plastocyanin
MQPQRKHLPVVGILGLVVIAAAGGGIYYYQFVLPHAHVVVAPVHRLVFMTAIVEEEGGFHVTNTAILNQTSRMPAFTQGGGPNMTGVTYQKYLGNSDNKTIDANTGDTITFYIYGENATFPCGSYSDGGKSECWLSSCAAHGFTISGAIQVDNGTLGGTCGSPSTSYIPFQQWYTVTVTFTAAGTYSYFCTIPCSDQHGSMNGNIVVS